MLSLWESNRKGSVVDITYQVGFNESMGDDAATLYEQAFSAKLRPGIADEGARLRVLAAGLDPMKSIAALAGGRLVGLAGFHDVGGSLTGAITWGVLREHLGVLRALRAAAVFVFLERKPEDRELLMDGIAVHEQYRGRGIGTGLFETLQKWSRRLRGPPGRLGLHQPSARGQPPVLPPEQRQPSAS